MAEKERKKRVRKEVFQSAAEPAGTETQATAAAPVKEATSGSILRQTREEKGLTLENVSSTIHLRVSQLRAIEEGQLSQLPGMTYAVGFVRSYAKFLKLNSEEIVTKFKQENGASGAVKPELHFPAPLTEGKTPGPMVIGVSTVFVVALLVLWAIFSGGGDTDIATDDSAASAEIAADAQPADAMTSLAADQAAVDAAAPIVPEDAAVDAAAAPAVASSPVTPATVDATAPAVAGDSAPAVTAAPLVAAAPAVAAAPVVLTPEPAEYVAPAPAPAVVAKTAAPQKYADALPGEDLIVVKQPKGRVVLQAKETSWVQITDKSGKIIFKKVMKPGEKFSPPDDAGLTMVTSNAGGLKIAVDGGDVNTLGVSGDIVRGVSLDPQSLKNRKPQRIRNY